ncbi:hypothetical protein [Brunnivagina elsteri]|uniref:hypothetical protein n=1 Tax=Brunnivagina elsteri TaxID=1247191 RepID=UPI001B80735D|nr:hypothetical protein [Calothrix elsteri]
MVDCDRVWVCWEGAIAVWGLWGYAIAFLGCAIAFGLMGLCDRVLVDVRSRFWVFGEMRLGFGEVRSRFGFWGIAIACYGFVWDCAIGFGFMGFVRSLLGFWGVRYAFGIKLRLSRLVFGDVRSRFGLLGSVRYAFGIKLRLSRLVCGDVRSLVFTRLLVDRFAAIVVVFLQLRLLLKY